MIDKLTLLELLRCAAWGFFGGFPLFMAYGAANEPEKMSEGTKALFVWLTIGGQIGFGVAAYTAGMK